MSRGPGKFLFGAVCIDCLHRLHHPDRPRRGLTRPSGRQVLLGDEHKVIFSTPDSSMARTGVSSGMGFPELCLSEDHADVLISYVGAAMKKLKKNDPYRDTVPSHFRRLKSFCDVMAANIASHDANETSASLLTEELFFH